MTARFNGGNEVWELSPFIVQARLRRCFTVGLSRQTCPDLLVHSPRHPPKVSALGAPFGGLQNLRLDDFDPSGEAIRAAFASLIPRSIGIRSGDYPFRLRRWSSPRRRCGIWRIRTADVASARRAFFPRARFPFGAIAALLPPGSHAHFPTARRRQSEGQVGLESATRCEGYGVGVSYPCRVLDQSTARPKSGGRDSVRC